MMLCKLFVVGILIGLVSDAYADPLPMEYCAPNEFCDILYADGRPAELWGECDPEVRKVMCECQKEGWDTEGRPTALGMSQSCQRLFEAVKHPPKRFEEQAEAARQKLIRDREQHDGPMVDGVMSRLK
jgi:hypothetical protein